MGLNAPGVWGVQAFEDTEIPASSFFQSRTESKRITFFLKEMLENIIELKNSKQTAEI